MPITSDGENEMLKKSKVTAIALLVSVILLASPLMLVQGQTLTSPTEKVVWVAENAAQQVQNLIDLISADDDAPAKINAVGLTEDFEANVTLYETDGLANLAAAQEALANSDYESAVDSAGEALRIFREVYSSIHVIMNAADLQRDDLIENQGLLEAITRELQRIDRLREILPDDAPQTIKDLLDDAQGLLDDAKELLLAGDFTDARTEFLEAKGNIAEVYEYLKVEAEETNEWRLSGYCAGLQERIRERFRYGQEQGVDFTGVLQSYGYQSESQYMAALQNRIQTAQGEQNFGAALQDCEGISQMVQQMEQALNQEIGRHQAQNGPGGNDSSGYGGSGSGGSGSGSGSGYGGSGP